MHMVSELSRRPVSQDTLLGYTWSLTRVRYLVRARDLASATMAGANMTGANMARANVTGANVAGARSQQARAASVRLTDGISGSGFLRV